MRASKSWRRALNNVKVHGETPAVYFPLEQVSTKWLGYNSVLEWVVCQGTDSKEFEVRREWYALVTGMKKHVDVPVYAVTKRGMKHRPHEATMNALKKVAELATTGELTRESYNRAFNEAFYLHKVRKGTGYLPWRGGRDPHKVVSGMECFKEQVCSNPRKVRQKNPVISTRRPADKILGM